MLTQIFFPRGNYETLLDYSAIIFTQLKPCSPCAMNRSGGKTVNPKVSHVFWLDRGTEARQAPLIENYRYTRRALDVSQRSSSKIDASNSGSGDNFTNQKKSWVHPARSSLFVIRPGTRNSEFFVDSLSG